VTTTSTPPAVDDAAWGSPAPTAWTLEAEGSTTLWAWAKDSANVISPAKSASILYSTATPAVSNVIARGTTDGTVAIRWDTDVPALGNRRRGFNTFLFLGRRASVCCGAASLSYS